MTTVSMGAIAKFHHSEQPKSVLIESVPTDANIPESGLTLIYGFRETIEEMRGFIAEGERVGDKVCMVKIEMEAGRAVNLTPETLKESRLLNMFSMTAALAKEVKVAWRKILKDDGIEIESLPDDYFAGLKYVTLDPQYVEKLREFDQFKHIEAICYPYLSPGKKIISKRVTLFSLDHITNVENVSSPEIEIELPTLGPKQARGPKLR